MKVIIFGAAGKTGVRLLQQSLQNDHRVTAFIRHGEELPPSARVQLFVGDVMNLKQVEEAMKGVDAVLVALGVPPSTKMPVLSQGTKNIITAMEKHKVRRLICITALGVGESFRELPLLAKLAYPLVLTRLLKDKRIQEQYITESGLDWTIIRPTMMTNGKARGRYRAAEHLYVGLVSFVSRADVAEYMVKILADPKTFGKAIAISD